MDRTEAAKTARARLFGAHADHVERICTHGEGIYLFDDTGKRYIDMASTPMTCCIGYGNRKVAQAAAGQMEKLHLCWSGFWINERKGELAGRILKRVPENLTRFQFVNSGSEATDSAIKFAYQYHLERGKPEKRIIIMKYLKPPPRSAGAGGGSASRYGNCSEYSGARIQWKNEPGRKNVDHFINNLFTFQKNIHNYLVIRSICKVSVGSVKKRIRREAHL